jgi:hypothetical protein
MLYNTEIFKEIDENCLKFSGLIQLKCYFWVWPGPNDNKSTCFEVSKISDLFQ